MTEELNRLPLEEIWRKYQTKMDIYVVILHSKAKEKTSILIDSSMNVFMD